jgi:ribonuclease E
MLIDAAHPEETRVVVTSGHRLEEFDFESSTKKQVKGNIYLAKITRVEPSLQAAFVDYGGNRHGFLAFSEIHPDYYRIPVSDRSAGESESPPENGRPQEDGGADAGVPLEAALPEPVPMPLFAPAEDEEPAGEVSARDASGPTGDTLPPTADGNEAERADELPSAMAPADQPISAAPSEAAKTDEPDDGPAWKPEDAGAGSRGETASFMTDLAVMPAPGAADDDGTSGSAEAPSDDRAPATMALRAPDDALLAAEVGELPENRVYRNGEIEGGERQTVETLGGDEVEEVEEADAERRRSHPMRHYKIQEVIKRRQIMLVQVAKEERGNKGAALTTYLSLAGRYCVLMPNTGRGGGVSRKISSLADRRRLKDILEDLDIPEGMGVIVRTAGAERSKAEVKRDYEYLLRLWNEIRDLTLKSTAPALIYEEGNLIKRSIRDLYTRDLDEVLVEGEEGYKTAKAFMRTLMPSHAKRVQPYRDPEIGLFHRHQIESQIDAIHSPVAQLRSGGYLVINQTEALVAIDVNSGRSTRERNIEETALRTNLEAADEIARQLRLRDLAGLIVIDFIDMEEHRNQVAVERRVKEALKSDRARIQVGRISPFGLLEMSRQRLRPSLAEASTQPCPHCGGTGSIRSVESTALYVLRSIEEEGIRRRSAEICVYVPTKVALYILNQKRESVVQIEARYAVRVTLANDDSLIPPNFRLERLRPYEAGEAPPPRAAIRAPTIEEEDDSAEEVVEVPAAAVEATAPDGEEDRARRRRRRRRRRPDEPREARSAAVREPAPAAEPSTPAHEDDEKEREAEAERRRRRRGRRGGRTRPRREEAAETVASGAAVAAATIEIVHTPVDVEAEERIDRDAEMPLAPTSWPAEVGIETASLAPLAGEGSQPAPVPEEPRADEPEERRAGEPEAAQADDTKAPIRDAGEGIPFTSETERVFEQAAADATPARHEEPLSEPSSRPGEDLQTVTEKPANPRRGWWQRLIQ